MCTLYYVVVFAFVLVCVQSACALFFSRTQLHIQRRHALSFTLSCCKDNPRRELTQTTQTFLSSSFICVGDIHQFVYMLAVFFRGIHRCFLWPTIIVINIIVVDYTAQHSYRQRRERERQRECAGGVGIYFRQKRPLYLYGVSNGVLGGR